MPQEILRDDVVRVKDHHDRKFKIFTNNFYIMKAALRYFAVKQGLSFTSSKVADNFPINVSVAGSCLKVLSELEVIEERTSSSSPNRYLPGDVNMERLKQIEGVLSEGYEINDFWG